MVDRVEHLLMLVSEMSCLVDFVLLVWILIHPVTEALMMKGVLLKLLSICALNYLRL